MEQRYKFFGNRGEDNKDNIFLEIEENVKCYPIVVSNKKADHFMIG